MRGVNAEIIIKLQFFRHLKTFFCTSRSYFKMCFFPHCPLCRRGAMHVLLDSKKQFKRCYQWKTGLFNCWAMSSHISSVHSSLYMRRALEEGENTSQESNEACIRNRAMPLSLLYSSLKGKLHWFWNIKVRFKEYHHTCKNSLNFWFHVTLNNYYRNEHQTPVARSSSVLEGK